MFPREVYVYIHIALVSILWFGFFVEERVQYTTTLGSEKFTSLKFGDFGNFGKQANANLCFSRVTRPD